MERTMQDTLSSKQVAEQLGVLSSTIRTWVARGKLTPLSQRGRYRFAPAEVERFMAEHCTTYRVMVNRTVNQKIETDYLTVAVPTGKDGDTHIRKYVARHRADWTLGAYAPRGVASEQ